jgi:hypothetical protein
MQLLRNLGAGPSGLDHIDHVPQMTVRAFQTLG